MDTIEYSVKEEQGCGNNSHDTDFISFCHFIYFNNLSQLFILPYFYLFNILLCWCGPGSFLRGISLGVRVLVQSTYSATINWFWFLIINHPILGCISMMVILTAWKKGEYMDEYRCGSSGFCNFPPYFPLENVVVSFYC